MTDPLKLENQICFPLYTVSRMVIQGYTPLLDELEITYPQYLVLLVLWEKDPLIVSDITKELYLSTSTITPLLKRLESKGFLVRERSELDERKVIVRLTESGRALKEKACSIPEKLLEGLPFTDEELKSFHGMLKKFMLLATVQTG